MPEIKSKLDKILLSVEKPSRYTGGEYNSAQPEKAGALYRFCFCFPDIYEIGMSNLGIAILYDIVNKLPEFIAERCFAVKEDMRRAMEKEGVPLFSLESKRPLGEFDIVGFSMQYELLYSNLLYMLELAKIPFRTSERGEDCPIIIAGGPCTANPEPFADFFDAIIIGEGEEATEKFCKLYSECKKAGLKKSEFLKRAKAITGVYVPAQFERGEKVVKAAVKKLDDAPYPLHPIVPAAEAVHDRAVVELYRGCASGCRFCQAAFWYRPIREKSPETVLNTAKSIINNTGFDEITLASLSSGDYTHLERVLSELSGFAESRRVNIALPSLRLSGFSGDFVKNSRKSSLTFAPEAGTQRLRDVINKNITDADIDNIAEAFREGYNSVKLYFMLGLPTETLEDIEGIAEICRKLRRLYIEYNHKKDISISVSCSVFIPKPATPFQWERQLTIPEILERQAYLRGKLREIKGVTLSWHGAESSKLEAALARGGRELSKVIERAYALGAKFDGWTESFDYEIWKRAFFECGLDLDALTSEIAEGAELPWDFIDIGIPKSYFLAERKKAFSGKTTESCRRGCRGCGANALGECSI